MVSDLFHLEDMVFSYFTAGGYQQTVPHASIDALQLFRLIHYDGELETHTEDLRRFLREKKEKEFKELKNRSAFVTASAVMNGVDKSKKSINALSGLVFIDIDSHSTKETKRLKAKLATDKTLPWVLTFESVRNGAKVLVGYDPERYTTEQVYTAFSAYLVEKMDVNPEDIDKGCKNSNRLTYLYGDKEAVFNESFNGTPKDAFPMEEYIAKGESLFGKTRRAKETSKKDAAGANSVQSAMDSVLSETKKEAERQTDNVMKTNFLNVAKYALLAKVHICDDYDSYFHFVTALAHDFPHDEEVKEMCRKVCQVSDGYDEAHFDQLYAAQANDVRGENEEKITAGTAMYMLMKALGTARPWPHGTFSPQLKLDRLPEVMTRLAELDTDPLFCDINTIAALTMLGQANDRLCYINATGQIGHTNLYTLFIGKPASSKSKIKTIMYDMPSLVNDELKRKTDCEVAEWKAKNAEGDTKEPKPRLHTFTLSADTTTRALVNGLEANGGCGCIVTTELQHLVASKNQKNGYGDVGTVLLQSYESEQVSIDRAEESVRIDRARLSLVGTGTKKALERLIDPDAFDSGLASRCGIYNFRDQVSYIDFGQRHYAYEHRKEMGTEEYLKDYFHDFYHTCQTLRKDVVVKTTPEQDTELQLFASGAFVQFHDLVFAGNGYTQEDLYGMPILKRAVDRALRIAALLAALDLFEKRRKEGKTTFFDDKAPKSIGVSDELFSAAILIAQVLMNETFKAVGPIIERIKEAESVKDYKKNKVRNSRMVNIFRKLPSTFTSDTMVKCGGIGQSRAYDYLHRYKDNGWVECLKSGVYEKLPGSPGYEAAAANGTASSPSGSAGQQYAASPFTAADSSAMSQAPLAVAVPPVEMTHRFANVQICK